MGNSQKIEIEEVHSDSVIKAKRPWHNDPPVNPHAGPLGAFRALELPPHPSEQVRLRPASPKNANELPVVGMAHVHVKLIEE
eukprot:3868708-Pyramimonas_sp.AAC.1